MLEVGRRGEVLVKGPLLVDLYGNLEYFFDALDNIFHSAIILL
jgi:hypothetical protein